MRNLHVRLSVSLAASLVWQPPVLGRTTPIAVPFDLIQSHLVVAKGSLGRLHNLNLLIDTGSIPSMVDQKIARKLKLKAEPSTLVAFGQAVRTLSTSVSGLAIGTLEPSDLRAGIGDLSYLGPDRVDAIVGLDVLARTSFGIDYKARTLSFGVEPTPEYAAPLRIVWPFVTVQALVDGHPLQLLVDTGSPDIVLFESRMPAALRPIPWRGDKVVQYAGGPARLRRYDLRQVTIGNDRWIALRGYVLDRSLAGYPEGIDGVLGVLALGESTVHFDFEHGVLGWTR